VRISASQIRIRAEVTEPDIVMVLDPGLLNIVKVTNGLKKSGILVVNTKDIAKIPSEMKTNWRVALVDANLIAREILGVPIVNTTMLGALIKASGAIKLESIFEPLQKRFGRLAEKNFNAMKRAFDETLVKEAG
jgi:pyruvate ferredoxin oxidoreductase gamma subunit